MKNTFVFDDATLLTPFASELIQGALNVYDSVIIPELAEPILLNKPIVLFSGKHLIVHPKTVIRLHENCGGCMVRNAHPFDGRQNHFPDTYQDHDICVEGGIWEFGGDGVSPYEDNSVMRSFGESNFFLMDGDGNMTNAAGHEGGGGFILGVIFLSNVENFTVRKMTIRENGFYGILIAGGKNFRVEDIVFDHNKMDGIHINGPSSYGTIQRISGTTGDDFIALNAWDWNLSAVSFGAIHHIDIDKLSCESGELRLLPGRKTFDDGSQVECPIHDCTFSNMEGIYCYKMYQQPNCTNELTGANDKSDIPGRIDRVSFTNIQVNRVGGAGVSDIAVEALFEICADCENLLFQSIHIQANSSHYDAKTWKMVKVGPKSATWKRGHTDPDNWSELFDTELICTAENITIRAVSIGGEPCTDTDILIGTSKLSPNLDYPKTTPRGGNGYGIVKNIYIES